MTKSHCMLLAIAIVTSCRSSHAGTTFTANPDGATVYDTANQITWLADANLPATNRFGLPVCNNPSAQPCVNASGSMNYQSAAAWVGAMNAANYLGHSNWQLPTTPAIDKTCGKTGPTGGSFGFGCTAGALDSLYNASGFKAPNTAVPISANTVGPFNNFQPYLYWTQTPAGPNQGNATFSFATGWQGANTLPNFLYLLPMIDGKLPSTPAGTGNGLQVNPDKQTVYDPVTNITWLANANVAATNTFGLPLCKDPTSPAICIAQDGAMTWDSAVQFLANMNAAAYLGQTHWQAPLINGNCPNYNCSGTKNPMGNLFYDQLGFSAGSPVIATPNVAAGPFRNLQPYLYWTCGGTTIQSPCQADGPVANQEWSYSFGSGFQGTDVLANDLYVTAYFVGQSTAAATPTISKVANAEGESPTIAPNTWVEIKGASLAPAGDARIWQGSDFSNGQMPTRLDGVSVSVNGKAAYIYYISATQINVLTPPDALSGSVPIVVTNNGAASFAFSAQAQTLSPSLFVFSDGQHVAAVHADGRLLGPTSFTVPGYTFTPAKPGETVLIYANEFGPTNAAVASGSSFQSGTLTPAPVITIGGLNANVTFAGLVSPGEFQFNVVIPLNVPAGDQIITATYNGSKTQSGTLLTIAASSSPTAAALYVSPDGNDLWSGTLPAPNNTGSDGRFANFAHSTGDYSLPKGLPMTDYKTSRVRKALRPLAYARGSQSSADLSIG